MSGHGRKDTLTWLVLGDKLAFFARMTLDRLNIALLKVQAHCPRLKRLTPRLPCAVNNPAKSRLWGQTAQCWPFMPCGLMYFQ